LNMEKVVVVVGVIVLTVITALGVSLVLAYPTMLAWNYVMPHAFGLPTVGLWHAFALNYLATTFFKSSLKCEEEKS
jgi:hypothetical protein